MAKKAIGKSGGSSAVVSVKSTGMSNKELLQEEMKRIGNFVYFSGDRIKEMLKNENIDQENEHIVNMKSKIGSICGGCFYFGKEDAQYLLNCLV
jgi:hypothetical protein